MHGWIFLNKPHGISSRQALNKVMRIVGVKKAGFVGTLDPFATGVLPLAFGEALKTISYLEGADKEYRFKVKWGVETTTGDLEGDVIAHSSRIPIKEEILAVLPSFLGEVEQRPPKFSAIKIQGQRAYTLARNNIEFECPMRHVFIYSLSLIYAEDEEAEFIVSCSKGTYVRQLAVDIAAALGTYAVVTELHRSKLAKIDESMTISLDFLEKIAHDASSNSFFHPLSVVLDDISAIDISEEEEKFIRYGQQVSLSIDRFPQDSMSLFEEEDGEKPQEMVYLAKCQNKLVGFVIREGLCIKAKRLFCISL